MSEKTCSRCLELLPVGEFHRHKGRADGLSNHCKACEKKRFKAHYDANPALREKVKERAIAWGKKNPEARLAIEKRRNSKQKRMWPEKHKARAAVHARVYTGIMPAPSTLACSQCGGKAAHYHHHKGYAHADRYDVIPVCPACHFRLDRSPELSTP